MGYILSTHPLFRDLAFYAIAWGLFWHMVFGAGEALNHGVWHWFLPKDLPRFLREGRAVHMRHHGHPQEMAHIIIPRWGHIALLKGIVIIGFTAGGVLGTLPLLMVRGISWGMVAMTYLTLAHASMIGMGSYMWLYGVIHRNTHHGWPTWHPLYATSHMQHHEKGGWDDNMPILPIYGWLMWLKPVVMAAVKVWKRWEDNAPQQTPGGAT
jgi:hypothetical protein